MIFLELSNWRIEFKKGWDAHFEKFDDETKKRILKKLEQMKQPLSARNLHSLRYRVEEMGQYRIAFVQDEQTRTKIIYFIGNHKQYEKWYKGRD